jgi:hypothetical protein
MAREKLESEIRCDENSDESVKPKTVSPKSASSSAKSSSDEYVNSANLLSPRTNII